MSVERVEQTGMINQNRCISRNGGEQCIGFLLGRRMEVPHFAIVQTLLQLLVRLNGHLAALADLVTWHIVIHTTGEVAEKTERKAIDGSRLAVKFDYLMSSDDVFTSSQNFSRTSSVTSFDLRSGSV